MNSSEGVGIIEAPRGTLIHHYKVNDDGAMVWANLIVATGHNNLAISKGVEQVASRFVNGRHLEEGAEPGVGPGARLRPVPELLHPRTGHGAGEAEPGRPRRRLMDEKATDERESRPDSAAA